MTSHESHTWNLQVKRPGYTSMLGDVGHEPPQKSDFLCLSVFSGLYAMTVSDNQPILAQPWSFEFKSISKARDSIDTPELYHVHHQCEDKVIVADKRLMT